MSKTRAVVVVVLSLLVAASLQAVTYVVPTDRDLVRRADIIVIATATESRVIETDDWAISTVTRFNIDDQLKGDPVAEVHVSEPGGNLNGRIMLIPGAPQFVEGIRYLLFLHRMASGRLTVYGLGLGKFNFTSDINGEALLARGATEAPLGWSNDGSLYIEKLRGAPAFLAFVRTVAKSPNAPAVDNYTLPMSSEIHAQLNLKPAPEFTRPQYLWSSLLRWSNNATATIGYCCGPTFQPSFDGPSGASTATGMWDGTGVIHYSLGSASSPSGGCVGAPKTTAPCGGLRDSDGANTILFDDPNNELAGYGAGIVALGGVTSAGSDTTILGDGTYTNTHEIDAVIAKSTQFPVGISQAIFAAVVTHELGHTLGFRHADGTGDPGSPADGNNCTSPLPCSSGYQAIMEHIVGRTSLGQWDLDAANTVYGAGVVCTNPSISAQPQSTSITVGNSATLSVTASGTNVTYQWFQGNPGSGSAIGGATSSSLFVSPSSTTTYYVVVSGCGTSATSSAATVTVTCQNPGITSQPQSQSIVAGGSGTSLFVGASGSNATYQWFQGNPGSGSAIPGATSSSVFINPSTTTTYYVVVTACGTSITSSTATVTVAPCTSPAITAQPQSTSVLPGGTATLTVTALGSNLSFQWFIGTSGITSQPVNGGNSPTLFVNPTGTTSYWVRVSGACGSPVNSNTATVTIGVACSTTLSSITANPTNPLPGQTFTLTANATTTSGTLSYKWYLGSQGDTSNPLGTTQSINATQTSVTQNYWVIVTSSCGGVAPASQITVSLNTGTCGTNANQLCIDNARYRVTLTARDPSGKTGQGQSLYQSDVFGYFSLPDFSSPSDPQVFVKVLGPIAGPNGSVPWVFYSGLTNLDYTVAVVDTQTGQTFNGYHVAPPSNPLKSVGDFDVFGAHSTQCSDVTISSSQTGAGGSCANTASALCLLNRFSVTSFVKDNPSRSNNQGPGAAVPVNNVFGFFTAPSVSPNPTDIQAFIKMIDATSFTGKFWVFLGGLTDFDVTFTVTDTVTGKQKIYDKPAGSTCGLNDTSAF